MSFGSGSARVVALLLTLLVGFAAACGGSPSSAPSTPSSATAALPPPQFPNYPAEANEFRFHWSAAPGIDLDEGPAVAVRAYVESMRLAVFAGGDPSAVYPGFMRATPENIELATGDDLFEHEYVRPETRAQYEADGVKVVERPVYGYQPTHILSLELLGDSYRAIVCVGAYAVYRTDDEDHSKFMSTIANPKTGRPFFQDSRSQIHIWRIDLIERGPRDVDASPQPLVPEVGPLPAPVDDVFGPWFITGSSNTGHWGSASHTEHYDTPEVRAQCEAAMPDDAAARMAMSNGFHSAPPPHGDAIPGWPAETR
jgi:hypothetical protein